MLPVELMKQIRLLEIRTNRIVDEITGGAYRSVFKGRGIEFDEVREYTIDDDVRDIDWNVSARMNAPYVKKYIEERELNVLLMLDLSASGNFGSGDKSKRRTAAELAALLAFSAAGNGDKVSLLLFTDRTELYVPPRKGRKHTLRMIRDMLAFEPKGKKTDIGLALREAKDLLAKRSVIFLLSDFVAGGDFESALKTVNRKHDLIAVRVRDEAELAWPLPLGVEVEDAETGETISFGGTAGELAAYGRAARSELDERAKVCARAQVDLIDLHCGEDPLKPLVNFFNRRRRRIRR